MCTHYSPVYITESRRRDDDMTRRMRCRCIMCISRWQKGPGPTQEGYYKNVDLLTTSWFFPDVFVLCVCIVYSKVIMCCYMSVKLVKAGVVVKGLFLRRKMVQCRFSFSRMVFTIRHCMKSPLNHYYALLSWKGP